MILGGVVGRPSSASQAVYGGAYGDHTSSPIAFGSPGSSGALGRVLKGNTTTSPTPAQAAWSLRQVKINVSLLSYKFNTSLSA